LKPRIFKWLKSCATGHREDQVESSMQKHKTK
jgi:hypothetical protein